MKKILPFLGFFGAVTGTFGLPSFDPFADATAFGGTTYPVGNALSTQTNAMGDPWYGINTGGATQRFYRVIVP